jgi:cobaltochelatase CobN
VDLGIDFDPLLDPLDQPFTLSKDVEIRLINQGKFTLVHQLKTCRIGGDVVEILEEIAKTLVTKLLPAEDDRRSA